MQIVDVVDIMTPIKTALIGYGMAGRIFHAPFIHLLPDFELSMISTSNPESIRLVNIRYPETKVVPDARQILEEDSIELVFILTPNHTHYELTKAALLAGKNVVVDKPFTVTVQEADELIELAKKQGKLLTVYQNRRWTADFKTVRKIISGGKLGRIVEYTACFDRYVPFIRPKKWKEDGNLLATGLLYDLGPHLIDQVLQLFGMPEEVSCKIRYQRENTKIDDYFLMTLQYPGLIVNLHSGMIVRAPGPNFAIHGTKGSFIKYGLDVQEGDLDKGKTPDMPDFGKEPQSRWGTLTCNNIDGLPVPEIIESECGSYIDFFTNLGKALRGEEPLAVRPEDARNVIRIIESGFQSHYEHRSIMINP